MLDLLPSYILLRHIFSFLTKISLLAAKSVEPVGLHKLGDDSKTKFTLFHHLYMTVINFT